VGVLANPAEVHRSFPGVSRLNSKPLGSWEDDKTMNDESLEAEKKGGWTDSLFSSYETDVGKIYVITECDRSATTILLPEEY
jgi:hypothetical protein